ncbi:MAG: hypothetical protein NC402_03160 [Prevotella sp.]|nr:hypothetical protein [Prevotella sp.]MCM1075093.1 hypothetical protein [Ruminococcus sp.]
MSTQNYKPTLAGDYLTALGVSHTDAYTTKRFDDMPFRTMFGLIKLLEEYGVESQGWLLSDKCEISKLTPPFLARTPKGFVIVLNQSGGNVTYMSQGVRETVPALEFQNAWDGNVILSFPTAMAKEPEYEKHRALEFLTSTKKRVLYLCAIFLFLYAFISNRLYDSVSTILVAAVDIVGLYFTYLLVQKSVKIHNPAADSVCSVLQAGGCDSILELKASKFFGLFGWSEVGFSYFSVSLLTLLMFPDMLPWLALCNVCCLPFTVWSIWYQKFRAHKWCTLCVCVQASLWLLFFSYLRGGYIKYAWPLSMDFFVLGVTYVAVMLGINAIMPLMEKQNES